ncbi:MAG TPA: TonB family protein [Candidatus Sulfotelmatobacter sp.]|nr:TonB family protein [Candidatus Sulfotelmatobacter sp.]HEV2468781.1 TonB family protein [Candidatus Sulfotelmatobacter sp.]
MKIYFALVYALLTAACCAQTAPAASSIAKGDSVCLDEILISTPQPYDPAQVTEAQHKADRVLETIRKGAKFEDIAKKYSEGPSAAYGGAIGSFKRGQLAKSMEDKVFAMKAGDVSDIIRAKQGFVILKVTDCSFTTASGALGGVQIISDTRGVDFKPYVRVISKKVESNWYREIPLSAETKTGDVTVECVIARDGRLTKVELIAGSGDKVLDRAATQGAVDSSPFPPLPSGYTGPYLILRIGFRYNPDKSALN